jgi:hypothetical protein
MDENTSQEAASKKVFRVNTKQPSSTAPGLQTMMILSDDEPCLDVEAGMVEASNQMENQDAFLRSFGRKVAPPPGCQSCLLNQVHELEEQQVHIPNAIPMD